MSHVATTFSSVRVSTVEYTARAIPATRRIAPMMMISFFILISSLIHEQLLLCTVDTLDDKHLPSLF